MDIYVGFIGWGYSIVLISTRLNVIDRYQREAQVIELSQQADQGGLVDSPSQGRDCKTGCIGFKLNFHLIDPV